jgi:hypothetical protein
LGQPDQFLIPKSLLVIFFSRLELFIETSVVFFFSFLGTRTRHFNFSSRNSRQDWELFLVPEISWREGTENGFHENYGNRWEIAGKSWCLMQIQKGQCDLRLLI